MYVHCTFVHIWGANSGITLRELERLRLCYVTCTTKLKTICWSKLVDIVTLVLILEIV